VNLLSAARSQARRRHIVALAVLGAGLAGAIVAGLLAGSVPMGANDILHAFAVNLGISDDPERLTDSVLWAIRLPRVIGGAMVGAALGVTGAGLQGMYRNQMADPQLLGISAAAGLGAIAGIAVTPVGGPKIVSILGAAAAAIAAAWLMRKLARRVGESTQFVLVGVAVGLALVAWLGAIVLAWDDPRVPSFTFWVFGGLTNVTWSTLIAAVPLAVVGLALVWAHAATLDLLALGDDQARHLGARVDRSRSFISAGVGLAVGAAVGIAGVVGFVGIVVPLLVRRVVGPGHSWLIALSGLGGAVSVVIVDIYARTLASPAEIPLGLLTAAIGGPVFVWFLLTSGRFRT